jgi:hypothetical protein
MYCQEYGLPGMGQFGISHRDKLDDSSAFSCMVSGSNVPKDEGYEWGRFHLLAYGCYIVLDEFRVMNFTGLRRHGGTPPVSPEGKDPVNSAYRIMFVLYPPSSMLSDIGTKVIDLATVNASDTFAITPEMSTFMWVIYISLSIY